MGKLTASLFVSLDGYATDLKEEMAWVSSSIGPEKADFDYELHAAADVMVMGRVTYEIMAAYWPHARDRLASVMNKTRKVVFTRTATGPEMWENTVFDEGDLSERITALKREGDILVPGSVALVRSLMRQGLVDRLVMHVSPVILGPDGGRPLFEGYGIRTLALEDTKVFDHNVVVLEYRPLMK
ncbi:dihydrofolate reductase family protein [Nonomuraea sp. NPDC059022]|uniref:dihydrofolate reductase family protein n=1 Tax=Nonomuraea sp. NPDC059022 TaxID=3346705 RepID=UPI0036889578